MARSLRRVQASSASKVPFVSTTLTAAVLDRLAMHAIHIDVDGPSFRQHVGEESAKKRAADRGAKRKGSPSTEPRA
jgi:hypothetical protein